jgi:hypothetical protein
MVGDRERNLRKRFPNARGSYKSIDEHLYDHYLRQEATSSITG